MIVNRVRLDARCLDTTRKRGRSKSVGDTEKFIVQGWASKYILETPGYFGQPIGLKTKALIVVPNFLSYKQEIVLIGKYFYSLHEQILVRFTNYNLDLRDEV